MIPERARHSGYTEFDQAFKKLCAILQQISLHLLSYSKTSESYLLDSTMADSVSESLWLAKLTDKSGSFWLTFSPLVYFELSP